MNASEHGAILDMIYEVAGEPAGWPHLLEALADRLGGTSAWLSRLNLADGSGTGTTARIDPEMPRLYAAHFADVNPFIHNARNKATQGLARSRVTTAEKLVETSQVQRGEYYNDFMQPQDVHDVLILDLKLDARTSVAVNINRPQRWGAFTTAEVASAEVLVDHLRRAVKLGDKFADLQAQKADLIEALEMSPHPSVVVDGEARVQFANAAAVAMAARARGLRLRAGCLGAEEAAQTRRLHAQIAMAASHDPTLRRGGVVALTSSEGRLPLAVSIWPLSLQRSTELGKAGSVLVTCADPEARVAPASLALREVFGLTPAEAAVAAAFCEGAKPREIAVQLGVGFNTVRFHLASIFAKTGVKRQAELAIMFAQLARLPQ